MDFPKTCFIKSEYMSTLAVIFCTAFCSSEKLPFERLSHTCGPFLQIVCFLKIWLFQIWIISSPRSHIWFHCWRSSFPLYRSSQFEGWTSEPRWGCCQGQRAWCRARRWPGPGGPSPSPPSLFGQSSPLTEVKLASYSSLSATFPWSLSPATSHCSVHVVHLGAQLCFLDLLAPTPVSQWVIDSFRFGDSYRISELYQLVLLASLFSSSVVSSPLLSTLCAPLDGLCQLNDLKTSTDRTHFHVSLQHKRNRK